MYTKQHPRTIPAYILLLRVHEAIFGMTSQTDSTHELIKNEAVLQLAGTVR